MRSRTRWASVTRTLLALLVMGVVGAGVAALLLGLYWLCSLPRVGPWLFVLVVPLTVVVIGLAFMAGAAVVAPLTGPTVWAGASSWQAVRRVGRLIPGASAAGHPCWRARSSAVSGRWSGR